MAEVHIRESEPLPLYEAGELHAHVRLRASDVGVVLELRRVGTGWQDMVHITILDGKIAYAIMR